MTKEIIYPPQTTPSSNLQVKILQLFPRDMNLYGDWGNVLAIKRRLEWRGIGAEIINYNGDEDPPENVDMIIGGGGQDAGQGKVKKALIRLGPELVEYADNNMPMLVICGLYQLFGHGFTTTEGAYIEGIGLLDITTRAGKQRFIGNIVTKSETFGTIVGYENHSGLTYLGPQADRLATVVSGHGNNNDDDSEGARYKNVIGSYLHGSLLPKNPKIADYLIEKALKNKYGKDVFLEELDDALALKAQKASQRRPR